MPKSKLLSNFVTQSPKAIESRRHYYETKCYSLNHLIPAGNVYVHTYVRN